VLKFLSMKRSFPIHGPLGLLSLVLSWYLHMRRIEPFYSWFYCFAWWSYILMVDGVVYRLKGNSFLVSRTREFFLMIPWSVFVWLIFEAANLWLKNWCYINLPHSTLERWAGYAVSYGTVLPGLFETTELLEASGVFRHAKTKRTILSPGGHATLIALGGLSIASSLLVPEFLFPLIWVGFTLLLDPINHRSGGRSLLRDLEEGNPRKIYLLLVAGLICGLLWEFWNFWARSKWVYTVPFFDRLKGFEMPWLGFLGFPPFALEAYVIYNFISLFRFRRGWEESTYRLDLRKKTRPLTAVLAALLIVSFSVLIFRGIDQDTVVSYYSRIEDAYWIDPRYRKELPQVGVFSLEDLLRKTRDRQERDEMALRLLAPREELVGWIEKSELAQLKGLGIENVRLMDRVGIHSVSDLALHDPEKLYRELEQVYKGRKIPSAAMIRTWVREARKKVRIS
jgi:hypothetical protein